ncbi:MAG TPA: hypothetical protein VFA04_09245 [Bryobacteraceae bacterium]|nr:hypothetical protein [Bryobacteraceae bacterium]
MANTNTNVFRGADGSIVLAVDSGAEGDAAKKVIDAFNLTPVGRATNIEVQVASDLQPFHELGQRYPAELRAGNVNVSGSMDRAYINGALLKLLLGDAADSRPAGAFVAPTFNIDVRLENPARPGVFSAVTVHGVKIENWTYSIPEDDFVMEKVQFKALWVSVEDKAG